MIEIDSPQTSKRPCRIFACLILLILSFFPAERALFAAEEINQAKALSKAFREASQTVLPAVVQIKTAPDFDAVGIGSGVIIEASGVVLTNEHVTADEKTLYVQLGDGRIYKAVAVRRDVFTDLAVLKIDPEEKLPFAQLGNSDDVEIGDWVLAIGAPFSLDQSVCAGIISAKGRTLSHTKRSEMLQTDAAVNPGNSGGPLVNLDGQVIGVTTAIFSQNGAYQGISFAIPSNMARWVCNQLLKYGKVRRAYLGVATQPVSIEEMKKRKLPPRPGVRIVKFIPNGPAEKSNLAVGDIILDFNKKPILKSTDLQKFVEQSAAGSKGRLTIYRDGLTPPKAYVDIVLQLMPDNFEAVIDPEMGEEDIQMFQSSVMGFVAIDLHRALAKQLGTQPATGICVDRVDKNSPAFFSGLKTQMIIESCNGIPIKTINDFTSCIGDGNLNSPLTLGVRYGNRKIRIVLSK